ncbi:MAG: acyl-ACP--UDP-N-acetylglucosamine O-acyltransferase [Candidatus Omnitrophota bacterium]|nr:MAG: acyl-ACP--UDP-N-acetylglucosamine O-acyltransferase [Candidatus Omnitrophota bacterium]
MNIHPTAIISQKTLLAEDIEIGPHVLIEDDVKIGRGTKIYSHAHILRGTAIGDDCQIHIGAVLGGAPQIRQKTETSGRLVIGQRNIFREYATVHRSKGEESATIIGDDNYFMAFSHIAHDCSLGNHITICNGALIAGHAAIEDYAFISGNVTVHQFCRIGKHSMIGGLARVAKDVPPYMLIKGDSYVWAINSVGLRRTNFSLRVRSQIKAAFKLLYKSGLNVRQAIEQLQKGPRSPEIDHLIDFILHSRRGICAYKKVGLGEKIALSRPIITIKNLKCLKRQGFF